MPNERKYPFHEFHNIETNLLTRTAIFLAGFKRESPSISKIRDLQPIVVHQPIKAPVMIILPVDQTLRIIGRSGEARGYEEG